MSKKTLILIYILTIIAFFWELLSLIVYLSTDVLIFWQIASILISIIAIIIRLFVIDTEKFESLIVDIDIYSTNKSLNPRRFLNLMPIAMIFCTIADIVIPVSFIAGVLLFLIAHVLLIAAYSGIIHINPKIAFSGTNKILALVSTIILTIAIFIIYFTLLYSAEDFTTVLLIPYIGIITIMAIITYIGLGYNSRPIKFRLILCGGATLFLISDAILAYNKFNTPVYLSAIWIGGTYFLAIFMLQIAILFSRSLREN